MTATGSRTPRRGRPSAYITLLIVAWAVAMTARLYPQIDTIVRVDGRTMTVAEYISDRCGTQLGPAAEVCLAAAHNKARVQLRREQVRSVLIIAAPAVLYLLYLLLARLADVWQRRAAARLEGVS